MYIWKHFKTITQHKWLVLKGCFQVGLYWQGLLHDLSKYMPSEFLVGAKYYQGTQSPNNAERKAIGYSSAWLHHGNYNPSSTHNDAYYVPYDEAMPMNTRLLLFQHCLGFCCLDSILRLQEIRWAYT